MDWLSIAILCLIVAAFVGVVAFGIRNKIKGKPSCSCGGNCGACGLCHGHTDSTEATK